MNTMQKWGSERPLGGDHSKDAANNNPTDAALTSGDENSLTQPHKHRKGEKCYKKKPESKDLTRALTCLNWVNKFFFFHVSSADQGLVPKKPMIDDC